MTVRLLQPWNGNSANAVIDADRATEAALVSTLQASNTLTGGSGTAPNFPFDEFIGAGLNRVSCEHFGASPNAGGDKNQAAIQRALNSLGYVSITTPGTYTIASTASVDINFQTTSVCLTIPSNTTFFIGAGVVLKVAGGVNPVLLRNSDIVNGNSNIKIICHGAFDGNRAGTTRVDVYTLTAITLWFQNITNFSADGIELRNPQAWGIGVSACTKAVFTNTYFNYTGGVFNSGNQGGFQCQGGNTDITIRNTYGNCYDDMVAFVAHDFAPFDLAMGGAGPVTGVLIDGVQSDETNACWHLVRLLDSTSFPMKNAIVRNLQGPYRDGAVVIGPATGRTSSFPMGVLIDGVQCSQSNSAATQGTIRIAGNMEHIGIKNVERLLTTALDGATPKPVIDVASLGLVRMDVENVFVYDQTTNGGSVVQIGSGTALNTLSMTNIHWKTNAASPPTSSALVQQNGGGSSLGRMFIDKFETLRCARIYNTFGNVVSMVSISNGFINRTDNPFIATQAAITFPKLMINNVVTLNALGGANGAIKFTGLSGACVVQIANSSIVDGANPIITKSASESISCQTICSSIVKATLTPNQGDIVLDSVGLNDPVRWTGAAWLAL